MKEPKKLTDISTVEGQMIEYDLNDIPDLPLDVEKLPFKKYSEKELADTCLDTLDGVSVLNIPRPKTPAEEEELVNKFLSGLRKLFDKEDNWLFCNMLEADMDCCAQCNSCSAACHLYEMSGKNEMYRPNFRSEILRRIYHQYIKKEPLAKWRYGDFPLNWKTVVRLGELSYRCNLCRRCAQVCPIGVDNGMIAREIRKIFSQEMGFAPKELHSKGTELQMQRGSSTGMTPDVVKDNVEFIDEDYSEITGVGLETPFDKKGADILLIHNAGEIMAWPENVAAFTTIFNAAGIMDDKWLVVIAMGMAAMNIILLRNAFEGVPSEIEEAAIVDGATEFQVLSTVYIPMSKSTIATVALFFAISRWNGYFWARQMISNSFEKPLQVFIRELLEQYRDPEFIAGWNAVYASDSVIYALIVCSIVPILIIYPFIQKYFAKGTNVGGVKE